MKICVVGAGAIGGLLAAKLQQAGEQVSVIARGPHLAAIKANGLKLIEENGSEVVARVAATDKIAEAGRQDLVILGMKAHQVAAVVTDLTHLYTPDTMVLTAQNGIPWWYFFKHGGAYEGRQLESVDPGGVVAANLPIARVLASVVYPAAEITEPGVIKHIEGNRFSLSEIDNSETPRIKQVSETLKNAGFKAPVVSDVRAELWTKLWGNLSFNPVSALTHATLEDLCRYPLTRALVADMMREAQAVGEAARHPLPHPDRKTHRRRRSGRPAQDLDAAGYRSRPPGRSRCADRLGDRARTHRQRADAASRHRLCAGETFEQDAVRPARPIAHRHGVTAEIHHPLRDESRCPEAQPSAN